MRNDLENDSANRFIPVDALQERLEELRDLQLSELKDTWRHVYSTAPPKRMSHELLTRAIAYMLQENACGGLCPTTKRKLAKLVAEYDKCGKITLASTPLYKPGTKLIREWQGNTHSVIVLEDGFEFRGERYRSLSAVAKTITGAHWSGPRFFGIKS